MRKISFRWLAAMLVVLVGVLSAPAWADKRVALVIGISDYKVGGNLPQTLTDAEKIRVALADRNFDVKKLDKPNLTKGELEAELLAFSDRAKLADVAVLYFAGHGMQHDSDNWLIPASAELKAESHIRFEGVSLQDVVELMKTARFRIIVLDACRNNPFVVNWGPTMSTGEGLGMPVQSMMPAGSLVAFSAAPGKKVPNDGSYANALSRWIKADGVELKQMLDRVRKDVQQSNPSAAPDYVPRYDGVFSFSAGYIEAPAATGVAQPELSEAERRVLAEAQQAAAQGDDAALRARNAESKAKQAAMNPTACRNDFYAGECITPGQIVHGLYAWTQTSASDGESYAGQTRDGVRLLGVFSYPVSKNPIARYEGEWRPEPSNQGGERSGFGVMVYHNGDRMRGSFVKGQAHGFAVLDRPDRSRVAGRWDRGVPVEAIAWDEEGRRATPKP